MRGHNMVKPANPAQAMTGLWLPRSQVELLQVKADRLTWHSALTFLFVPKYQRSTGDILALAPCPLIGAPVKLKHSKMSKCQAFRAALQPKFNPALFLFYMFRFLRLFLHPSLGSLLPHPKGGEGAGGRGSSTKKGGRGGKRGKGRRKSQTRTFTVQNTLNGYLVVQSNYRLVGKYRPIEFQKIYIIDPVL